MEEKKEPEKFRGGLPLVEKDSIISKLFFPLGLAIGGASSVILQNFVSKRPLYSYMHKQLFYACIGATFGYYIDIYFAKKWANRDAVIKHYIELHPEDFEYKPRKFSEIFDAWPPIR